MRYLLLPVLFLFYACQVDFSVDTDSGQAVFRKDFSATEQKVLQAARQIIDSAYYGTLITTDAHRQPKARIMEPFAPDKNFVIYLATNPKSRKVKEIRENPIATLHYFDKKNVGYVSLYGRVYLVDNDSVKNKYWKKGWEHFYKNKKDAYMLLKFIPKYLEVISIPAGLNGDPDDWKPSKVMLIK